MATLKHAAQLCAAVSSLAGGGWMAFHTPEEWAAAASQAIDAGLAVGYVILNKLPSIESLAYMLVSGLARLFA